MFPQYAERNIGGEIAIWLLITVGALLVPIVVIAICCIRRHLPKRPLLEIIENPIRQRMKMNSKTTEALRSYDGPDKEFIHEDLFSNESEQSKKSNTNRFYSNEKHSPKSDKNSKPADTFLTPKTLIESPSIRRYSSGLSNIIQTATIPAGSTNANYLLTTLHPQPFTSITSTSAGFNSAV